MNWFKQNSFLSGLIAVAVIGVVGLGFLAFKAWGGYGDAKATYNSVLAEKQLKEREVPFPSPANAEAWAQEVQEYTEQSAALRTKARTLQVKMPEQVQPDAFQNSLIEKRRTIVETARTAGIELDENFDLGMGGYMTTPPQAAAASRLQFQLEAIDSLFHTLIDNGATSIKIYRPTLPFETGEEAEPPRRQGGSSTAPFDPVDIYPFEISVTASGPAFQQILNLLSNTRGVLTTEGTPEPDNFYYAVRFLRIENEMKLGPPRMDPTLNTGNDTQGEGAQGETTEPAAGSLNMAFGTEKILGYMTIDLVHFKTPPAEEQN